MPLNGWDALDPLDHWGLTELPNRWTSSTSLLRESIENPKETQHPRQAGTAEDQRPATASVHRCC